VIRRRKKKKARDANQKQKAASEEVDNWKATTSAVSLSTEKSSKDDRFDVDGVIWWERLTLDRRVDRGTIGSLFRATLDQGSEPLVVRRLNVEFLALHTHSELVEQVLPMRELNHPHILHVMGMATDGIRNYGILMEYMPRSLSRVLKRAEESPETAAKLKAIALSMMADIAGAVAYLHGEGFCHYALHPKNVFFDGAMSIKIGDYGRTPEMVTRQLEEKQDLSSSRARLQDAAEEPRQLFLAPELLRLESFAAAADVWSLGCLMARLGSLRRLYAHSSAPSTHIIMMRVAAGELSPADQLQGIGGLAGGVRLVRLVQACAKLEPRDRPTSAEVVRQLNDLSHSSHRHRSGDEGSAMQAARRKSQVGTAMPAPSRLPPSATAGAEGGTSALQAARRASQVGTAMPMPSRLPPRIENAEQDRTLKKAAPQAVAPQMAPPPDNEEISRTFNAYDKDGSGTIDANELVAALTDLGLSSGRFEASKVLSKYDRDGKGALSLKEFTLMVNDLHRFKAKRAAKKAKEKAQEEKQKPQAAAAPASATPSNRADTHAAAAVAGAATFAAAAAVKDDETIYLSLATGDAGGAMRTARVGVVLGAVDESEEEKVFLTLKQPTETQKVYLPLAPPRAVTGSGSGANPPSSSLRSQERDCTAADATASDDEDRNTTYLALKGHTHGTAPGSAVVPGGVTAAAARTSALSSRASAMASPGDLGSALASKEKSSKRKSSSRVSFGPVVEKGPDAVPSSSGRLGPTGGDQRSAMRQSSSSRRSEAVASSTSRPSVAAAASSKSRSSVAASERGHEHSAERPGERTTDRDVSAVRRTRPSAARAKSRQDEVALEIAAETQVRANRVRI